MSKDYFADIRRKDPALNGILAGEGVHSFEAVPERRDPDGTGIIYTCNCGNCGQPNEILVGWMEFVYGSMRMQPVDLTAKPPRPWVYDPKYGGWHPNVPCRACKTVIPLIVTPDECARHLRSGTHAGFITDQWVAAQRQRLQQAAAQMNQRRR